jgi:hypothetical protein
VLQRKKWEIFRGKIYSIINTNICLTISFNRQYSDEEDDNDSAGGHDSPLSDNGRPQPPTRSSNRHQ